MARVAMPMPEPLYVYEARQTSGHDADTFGALVRLGMAVDREISVRVWGVNAPELGTKAAPNKPGVDAAAWARQWLAAAARSVSAGDWPLILISKGFDKYGNRIDCIVYRKKDGRQLNADLLTSGHAVEIAG